MNHHGGLKVKLAYMGENGCSNTICCI